jgi:hypothetical protein
MKVFRPEPGPRGTEPIVKNGGLRTVSSGSGSGRRVGSSRKSKHHANSELLKKDHVPEGGNLHPAPRIIDAGL